MRLIGQLKTKGVSLRIEDVRLHVSSFTIDFSPPIREDFKSTLRGPISARDDRSL